MKGTGIFVERNGERYEILDKHIAFILVNAMAKGNLGVFLKEVKPERKQTDKPLELKDVVLPNDLVRWLENTPSLNDECANAALIPCKVTGMVRAIVNELYRLRERVSDLLDRNEEACKKDLDYRTRLLEFAKRVKEIGTECAVCGVPDCSHNGDTCPARIAESIVKELS